MLYIDNPAATGFSCFGSDDGYARRDVDVANDLYNALLQFFAIFREFKKNNFFTAGESYACKFI